MEEVSEDGGPQSGSFSFGESLGKASTGWRSSPEQQAPSGRAHGDEGGADWYDIASNASSEGLWWKGDSWSWYSWDGGSDRSRSNWVYVARSGGDGWKRDGWHQWHGSRGGRDGRELHSGLCQESAECREDPGAPSESYREWKRAVKFWLKGEGQQLPYHLVGPRVMVQLRERAGQLVKHLEPEDVDDKQGLEKIFAVLEKSPLIRQSEKHRVDWHRKRLLALTRLPGESLESYITRASLYRDQLQGLDAGLAMGERFFVGHLLDHARITKRDKAMIKTHAVKETEIAITEAMMELAAELEGEAGCPIGQSESQVSGANGEEHMVQRGVVGFRFGKKEVKPALAVDGADDVGTEMAYSLDGIAEEGPGNDSCDEPDLPADVLHAEHEALALQFKAKQKMAEVRKMRNYYRKNDGDGRKGGGRGAARCFVCDEVGHLARDCPRAKAVNPSPVLMTTTANEETSAAAEWELLASLCRSPADASSVKEVYMVLSPQLGGEDNNTTFKMIQPHDTWWNLKELSRKVILDLGCMRNVVGLQWANDVIQSWKQKGRWLRVLEEEETFRFGDGNTLKSKYRLQMEATFGGRKVLLAFSVVPGPCPPLLSKQSHSMLGVQIDTANNTLSSKKLKISRYGLTETEAGHYAMSIDEFHVLKNDDETWKQNPPQMGIGEEVALFHVETADKEAFGSTHLGEQDQLLDGHFRSPVQPAGMSTLRQLESPDSSLSGDVGWQLRDDLPGECQSQGVVGGGEVAAGRGARSESQASTSQHGGGEKGNNTTAKQSSSLSRGATCGRDRGARDSWSDREGAGDDSEEEDQAGRLCQEEDREQGPHGHPSGLPVLVELLERGVDFQHFEEHAEPLGDLHVEEVGVAASSEGGNQCGVQGQGKVETQSTVASLPFELRGGGALGPLGNSEAEAEIERPPSMKEVRPQRGLNQKIKKAMEEIRQRQLQVLAVSGKKEHFILLEVFAGCARLTKVAKDRKGWEALNPVDIIYGDDLREKQVQRRILDLLEKYEPDLVTMSPRCGPWSQFQRINPNIDKVMEDRKQDIPLWRFCRRLWDEQTKQGRLALTENPWQSEALHLDFMKERPQLFRAKVAQCRFGLKDVVSGLLHQKYTALDVNNAVMCEALQCGALCNHAREEHQPIEGSVMWEGKSQRRSALAAQWPEELCRHMLQAAEKVWLHKEDEQFGIGLAEVADGGHHYALPVEPLPSPEGELRRQLEKVDWRGGQYDYIYFEGVARQAPYRIRRALAHLHVVLSHPSHDRLSRMLQVAGSGQVVTTTAHGLRCQICDAVRPTGSEPKASGERVTRFGEKVLSDSFSVWDHAGERFNVTHMLDSLTDYHIGVVSKTASAQVTAELLQHRWCGVFGVPETFQTDAGKEYEEVVSRLCRILDFRHEVVPPSAKWRQGQVERHGGIVKLMMMRVVATQQVVGLDGMKMVATACFAAKNRLANRMTLSPQQAVTGRNTSVPMSIMDQLCSGHVKQALNAQLDVRDALRRAERIRAAAIDSYHWMDSNEVLRRALHSRSRPPKLENLQEGMTVYVHDIPPSRRGLGKRLQDHFQLGWTCLGGMCGTEQECSQPSVG